MARRATPPALLAVRLAVRKAIAPAGLVLVGCSGGADSLALAGALALEAPGRSGLVTVDHGLQDGSAERAARLAEWGTSVGLTPSLALRAGVTPSGSGPEAAARDARLAALESAAARTGAVEVLLAHTRDDQAEQVLLGLARGAGARSLAGMRARRGVFRRPLLDLPRELVRAACADLGLDPWEDPHNSDPAYARSRVRGRVLPVLEAELGPGVAAALVRTAAQLAEDAEALDGLAVEALARSRVEGGAAAGVLATEPAAVRSRALRLAAAEAGAGSVTGAQVEALSALVCDWHGQGPVALTGGVSCRRQAGVLVFGAQAREEALGW